MSKLYLNGVLCNGSGRGDNEYTKKDLLSIAEKYNIAINPKALKEDICKVLIDSGIPIKQKPSSGKKTFKDMDELMMALGVENAIDLMDLTNDEMERIINEMKLFSGTVDMRNYMKNTEGRGRENERAKKFLKTIAEKYCRCLKGVEAKKSAVQPNAVCNQSIFNNRGLKAPGAAYQCSPTPLLLAPKGKTIVLERYKS